MEPIVAEAIASRKLVEIVERIRRDLTSSDTGSIVRRFSMLFAWIIFS